eukprot:TRINITY_DN13070_c0_g1_i1.p1 TRINITY_DN13070_c0_g1~~TRINITY_DN13070_c0_g1_i1.p1  ORF type:complete len:186 (+),score=15.62 TRINITY_DN13070_c0_g1_i1:64-558(+)
MAACATIHVKVFHLAAGLAYHSEVSFHYSPYQAYGPDKKVSPSNIPKSLKTHIYTITHEFDMPGHQFWPKVTELQNEWRGTKYNLLNHNCNSYADAALKRFGHPGLGIFMKPQQAGDKLVDLLKTVAKATIPGGAFLAEPQQGEGQHVVREILRYTIPGAGFFL